MQEGKEIRTIRILPGNIANMIAAGEVVQRPASVVKELMENAVDAGADQITVVVADAGRTLVQVIDNGRGMNREEAVLCFERHATSKIATAEDLENIATFGFRGEALASIAAVSEVTLKTRRGGEETGTKVEIAASAIRSTEETAAPEGSNFEVRNLFYNVPARRKFLRSDNVEFRHIVEEFSRVALTRPQLAFSLTHNGREIFRLKKAKSLKFRIQDCLGMQAVDSVVELLASTSVVDLEGYIGRPEAARKTPGNQYFFVNGRYFRSAYLHKAVMKAYEGLVKEGCSPAYFLYLTVDPHSMDVNVHPTKTDVKFEDDSVMFQIIMAAVKEAVGRNSFGASLSFEEGQDLPVFSRDFHSKAPMDLVPNVNFDTEYDPFAASGNPARTADYSRYVSKTEDYGRLFEESPLPAQPSLVISGKYIASRSPEGLLLVNVRRAMVRVLYERFLAILSKGETAVQRRLFPETVNIGVKDRLVLDENASLLSRLGFEFEPQGDDCVTVLGVPEGFPGEAGTADTLVHDLLLILSEDYSSLPGLLESHLAERFARLGAAEGGSAGPLPEASARKLLTDLFACDSPEHTPSGLKTMVLLDDKEIEKLF